jgi:dephospho-CoA kinase
MVLGLTGNIGCGKSTAGQIFEEQRYARIDCDEIVRELLSTDDQVKEEVLSVFSKSVFDKEGQILRKELAAVVFSDLEALKKLEGILHPRVNRIWTDQVQREVSKPWLVEIPLLFERNLEKNVDFTVCITCDQEVQINRLTQRGMTLDEANQRISRQMPLVRKVELADYVLLNNGSLLFLKDQITQLIKSINSL